MWSASCSRVCSAIKICRQGILQYYRACQLLLNCKRELRAHCNVPRGARSKIASKLSYQCSTHQPRGTCEIIQSLPAARHILAERRSSSYAEQFKLGIAIQKSNLLLPACVRPSLLSVLQIASSLATLLEIGESFECLRLLAKENV